MNIINRYLSRCCLGLTRGHPVEEEEEEEEIAEEEGDHRLGDQGINTIEGDTHLHHQLGKNHTRDQLVQDVMTNKRRKQGRERRLWIVMQMTVRNSLEIPKKKEN